MQAYSNYIIKIAVIIILPAIALNAYSQSKSLYSITAIAAKDGLPSSEIFCLAQDSLHCLWIGHSAGVSRYDGYHFENFLFADGRRIGIVHSIKQDKSGIIWIAADGGCFFYRNNQLHITLIDEPGLSFFDLCFDETGGAWFSCNKGPAYLAREQIMQLINFKKTAITPLVPGAWKKMFPYDEIARIIKKDQHNDPYFATSFALYRYNKSGLNLVWKADDPRGYITGIITHDNDSIYFSTYDGGLLLLHHDIVHVIRNGDNSGSALAEWNKQLYYLDIDGVKTAGFNEDTVRLIAGIPLSMNKWGSALLVDDEDNIWVGNHEGILFLRKRKFIDHSTSNPLTQEIYSIGQNARGEILLGANRGKLFAVKDNTFILHQQVVTAAEVKCIFNDFRNWLWFGTGYQGISVTRNGRTDNFTTRNGLRDNTNLFFYQAKNHGLWTGGDGGVTNIIADTITGRIHFRNFRSNPENEIYATFNSCIEGPDGSLWFGSNWGLFHLEGDSLYPAALPDASLKNIFIADMKMDARQQIWIATRGNGILVAAFDKKNQLQVSKTLNTADGLNSTTYLRLLADKENTIWAGSYSGITRIQASAGSRLFITNYSEADGFTSHYQDIALLQDVSGTIWAGTTNGITTFRPEHFKPHLPPALFLGAIQLPDTIINPEEKDQLLRIPYEGNSITFSFTCVHLASPSAINYFHRLTGADTSWIADGNNRRVAFQELPPGNYVFEVKAALSSNNYSNIIRFPFKILPPFWKTWWFITLTIMMILGLVYWFIKNREKRIEEKEAGKTALATSRLTALRAQMNPHFIFNALNSVQQYILLGNVDEANKYLSKFSRLQREILNHCDQSFISLEKEIEMLELYLQLEQLRLQENFTYSITTDGSTDTGEIKIAPMMLQPFVENSIWHGLMTRQGERKIAVHFSLQANGLLICTIEDNGIGRDAARLLKEAATGNNNHKSKGLSLVYERLKILRQQYQQPFEVTIDDVVGKDGDVQGTIVTLTVFAVN